MAISLLAKDELQRGSNLLAFSGGSDSSALFFLLLEANIPFDIAIVDYQLRPQSAQEVAYAKELATRYHKKIHIHTAPLQGSNIEARARTIRYHFFETIIAKERYHTLITAHTLNDLTEWFFMQMSKGAGLMELIGMEPVTHKPHYTLVRPLLLTPKSAIYDYLQKHSIRYFHDHTNDDPRYLRNHFRHTFVDRFVAQYADGIERTFTYLLKDRTLLAKNYPVTAYRSLLLAPNPHEIYETMRLFSMMAKRLGYLLSSKQKEEMVRQREGVVAGKLAFAISETRLYLAPASRVTIPKAERERFRRCKIPPPIRPYCYALGIDPALVGVCKDRRQTQPR